jgi:hypothetical protein
VVRVLHRNCFGCAHHKIVQVGAINDFKGRDLFVLAPGSIVNSVHSLILKTVTATAILEEKSHNWTELMARFHLKIDLWFQLPRFIPS